MGHKQKLKVGDRARNVYDGREGVVIDIWDGKFTTPCYEGEQYNPYRISVRLDNSDNVPSNFKLEHLERFV